MSHLTNVFNNANSVTSSLFLHLNITPARWVTWVLYPARSTCDSHLLSYLLTIWCRHQCIWAPAHPAAHSAIRLTATSHLHRCHLWRCRSARSLIPCKHPLSFTLTNTKTHKHTSCFCLMVRGVAPFSSPLLTPPPALYAHVFRLKFAWLLIWDAAGSPACCPAPSTHICGVKRIIHCFQHTTEVFEHKEQLPLHR